jgi:tetratricopeptide (TPR) repeat protein
MESAADRLNRAISLNNNAYALSNEGKLDLAMDLWVQSAMGGVPNALASYLWYALKTGKHTDAIKLYESCIQEIDFSIDPRQKSNCESNYALNLVAATENTSLGDAIWMRNSESGHLESKFFALQCAIMDDSAEREKLLAERISLSEFKLITKELIENQLTSKGWFQTWCQHGEKIAKEYVLKLTNEEVDLEHPKIDDSEAVDTYAGLELKNVMEEYQDKDKYLKQIKKAKSAQRLLEDQALVRFTAHHKPTAGTPVELLFSKNFVSLITPTTVGVLLGYTGGIVEIPRQEVIKIQLGTLQHTRYGGVSANTNPFLTVTVVTSKAGIDLKPISVGEAYRSGLNAHRANTLDGEYFIYLPLGKTMYQIEKYLEIYTEKFQFLSNFYPVSEDGGNLESSSGFRGTYSLGFWKELF